MSKVLAQLQADLAEAREGSTLLDLRLMAYVSPLTAVRLDPSLSLTSSVDAARRLFPDDWIVRVTFGPDCGACTIISDGEQVASNQLATPALALCWCWVALLREKRLP